MQAEIAVLRFGLGARPGDLAAAAQEPRAWLMSQIRGPVPLAVNAPLAPSDQIFAGLLQARDERQKMKQASAAASPDAKAAFNAIREAYQPHYRAQVLARAQSAALTTRPFAERLVHFWSNHFAVSADKGVVYGLAGTLENEAVRPHVGGRFVDLLTAVEQHPAMIAFLDNQYSVGKDSEAAARFASRPRGADFGPAKRQFGINENLAREILELHTLGVNGGYTQADVTSFAQIITGWSIGGGKGRLAGGVPGRFYFRDNLHEPGPKVFLGKTYTEQGQRQGEAVLADLARRPETANFIATKLVRHFIADDSAARRRGPSRAHLFEIRRRLASGLCGADRVSRILGCRCAQVQDSRGFRFLDLQGIERLAGPARRSHSHLRSVGPAAIHAGVAGGLARHLEKLGWLRCAHAPRVMGIARRRQV